MKIALITTTINVPRVLALYRLADPDVPFFIAGDRKTPDADVVEFLRSVPKSFYYPIDTQHQLGYACSALIGENCVQRRNIALLKAVQSGADWIFTTDDDNFPTMGPHAGRGFFQQAPLERTGLKVSSSTGWFDAGQLLVPAVRHRGFPVDIPTTTPRLATVVDAKIGVAAGLWVGDADVNAADRIAVPPNVHSASELAQDGVVVDPRYTWTVFNAQNVFFRRELAPAMFQPPGLGRADDIFASMICQRVMRKHGLYVHFGRPFTACWQDRSTRSLLDDLEHEIFLMRYVKDFARYLDTIEFTHQRSVLDQTRWIWETAWPTGNVFPQIAREAAFAFLDDIEKVL